MRSQVHPDDLSNLDAAFAALGRSGSSCRTEYRLAPRTDQERSGRERWVAIEGAVVRQADSRPVQLLGVTRDITERKQRSRHWQSATHSSPSPGKSPWSEASLSTSARGKCKFRRAMRLSTTCPREPSRPAAPIGKLEFTGMICRGWTRTSARYRWQAQRTPLRLPHYPSRR
jgi:PAS domain S-box